MVEWLFGRMFIKHLAIYIVVKHIQTSCIKHFPRTSSINWANEFCSYLRLNFFQLLAKCSYCAYIADSLFCNLLFEDKNEYYIFNWRWQSEYSYQLFIK